MRLLVLGGTAFLGRAVARRALAEGHQVTCLARGDTGQAVPDARLLTADRSRPAGLSILEGESFDAVVDVTSEPEHAQRAVAALGDRVAHWVYVSSISVYSDHSTAGQRADTAPVLPPAEERGDPFTDPEAYGRAKVACEQAVRVGIGDDRALVCRAGLIVGPEDSTWRFPYWVDRMARGGRVLAPGDPDDPVQLVDVRDLAAWLVSAAEHRLAGTYDAACAPLPVAEVLDQVAAGVGAAPTLVWVTEQFLRDQGVNPWSGERSLPLWAPRPEYAGLVTHDTTAALEAGLPVRSLADTAAATAAWLRAGGVPSQPAGLTAEQEDELLRAWDAAGASGPASA